ncbi:hypothetical protein E2C01_084555 [Portunus trituberculatus]|uniref:Uncharacterized protein n=1 Tax=Portunus trituberculatus TaxID=210409 RepID=A0A5B7IVM8_PORTR|nr:hypothetical protein [Portunus trituberculatus]
MNFQSPLLSPRKTFTLRRNCGSSAASAMHHITTTTTTTTSTFNSVSSWRRISEEYSFTQINRSERMNRKGGNENI